MWRQPFLFMKEAKNYADSGADYIISGGHFFVKKVAQKNLGFLYIVNLL